MDNYSILMSVYYREKPEHFRAAIASMLRQTVPTNDFVLVCDGPLTSSLDEEIKSFEKKYPDIFHIVRLPNNQGLGNALNIGMTYCKNELVARMDSDDIAFADRCEKQLDIFKSHPEIDIVSGTILEFSKSTNEIEATKVVPETDEEIHKFSCKRSPFNHNCVMYKKSRVIAAGGYQDFYLLEDYYLWLRMLMDGCKGYNIQDPILFMRAGQDLYKRRSGIRYAESQRRLFEYMYKSQYIGFGDYIYISTIRAAASVIPNGVRIYLYKKFLRK